MKLSAEQIAKIDENLVLNGVVYDDIKLELTDHIASDIENNIKKNDVLFEEAFVHAFENWKEQLRPSSSLFWAPFWLNGPKLFMDKWVKESKRQFFFLWLLSVVISLLIACTIMQNKSNIFLNQLAQGYEILLIVLVVFLFIGRYFVFKSPTKTIFSYMYNVHCLGSFLLLAIQLFSSEFNSDFIFALNQKFIMRRLFFSVFIHIWCVVYSIYSIYFLYNHFQFERKLAKV
jgi:uncharacterized integral membrane protein